MNTEELLEIKNVHNHQMKVGFFQSDLFWENPEENLSHFEEKIAALDNIPALILLPEMFNSGFSMNVKEPENFYTQKWMQSMADRYKTCIAGSYAVQSGSKKHNRFLWAFHTKALEYYDKRHLFSHGGEAESFTAGKERKIIELGGYNFLPQVCFDLRFPVFSRNIKPHYDVLVYVASWPEKRIEHWKTLLRARAIENQCYVIGVNRLGTDGNGLNYTGQSTVIKYDGEIMFDAQEKSGFFEIELSKTEIQDYREHFKFLEEQDNFTIH
jgi:omega-amidase